MRSARALQFSGGDIASAQQAYTRRAGRYSSRPRHGPTIIITTARQASATPRQARVVRASPTDQIMRRSARSASQGDMAMVRKQGPSTAFAATGRIPGPQG